MQALSLRMEEQDEQLAQVKDRDQYVKETKAAAAVKQREDMVKMEAQELSG